MELSKDSNLTVAGIEDTQLVVLPENSHLDRGLFARSFWAPLEAMESVLMNNGMLGTFVSLKKDVPLKEMLEKCFKIISNDSEDWSSLATSVTW